MFILKQNEVFDYTQKIKDKFAEMKENDLLVSYGGRTIQVILIISKEKSSPHIG